jgi:hypothetical protein
MRKFLMIGAVLCVGAVVVPAAASGARGRATPTASVPAAGGSAASVTVDPSTDLLDGQTVTVTGSGFKASTDYVLLECQAGATKVPTGCGLVDLDFISSDSTGSFSTPFDVARMITLEASGTTIDCAVQSCVLDVGTEKGALTSASAPISFDDVAIVPPTVSADPSTDLRDGQTITVSGTDFSPNALIEIVECETAGSSASCDPDTGYPADADSDGTFSTPYPVTRVIDDGGGPVDCAVSSCVIMAVNPEEADQEATTPIAFADVPIKTPTLAASPSTVLDDGATVTVSGKGFHPHDVIGLTECVAGSTDGSECVAEAGLGNSGEVKANGAGRFSTTFNVSRILTLFGATIDCAQAPGCVIGAIDLEGLSGSVTAAAPIGFDPSVPPLPALNLGVDLDPTATIVAGATKGNEADITGTMSCDRKTPVPVEYAIEVTEPVGNKQVGSEVEGSVSCKHGGIPFSIPVPSVHRHSGGSFVPGLAGVLLEAYADSGSSSQTTETNTSITLKAAS